MIVGPDLPGGYVIFCDDIRLEEGGKKSFMGVYNGEMIFPVVAPALMSNFCASVVFQFSKDQEGKSVKVLMHKDTDVRVTMFEASVDLPQFQDDRELESKLEAKGPDIRNAIFDIRMPGISFEEDCILRVRASVDDVTYRLGALAVAFRPPEEGVLTLS